MSIEISRFSGDTAGQRIRSALSAMSDDGGVLDCRDITGSQTLDVDVFVGLPRRPISVIFGAASFAVTQTQTVPSNCQLVLSNTTFLASSSLVTMFRGAVGAADAVISDASSASMTIADTSAIRVGDSIGVFGAVPRGGKDETMLNGTISDTALNITVDSTSEFPTEGILRIGDELMRYTSKSGNDFVIPSTSERGLFGTAAMPHGDDDWVNRAVYERFEVVGVNGTTVTVDRPLGVEGTAIPIQTGTSEVSFEGQGVVDGTGATSGSATGVEALLARFWSFGPTLLFRAWKGQGVLLRGSADSYFDSRCEMTRSGSPSAGVAVLQNSARVVIAGMYYDCDRAIYITDRYDIDSDWDNNVEDSVMRPRIVDGAEDGLDAAVDATGVSRSVVECPMVRSIASAGYAVRLLANSGWAKPGKLEENTVTVDILEDPDRALYVDDVEDGDNVFVLRQPGMRLGGGSVAGNFVDTATNLVELVAATNVAVDAISATAFRVEATSPMSVTVDEPTNPIVGRVLTFIVVNNSGGSATFAWDSKFDLAGTFTSPADGYQRTITFSFDGTEWIELMRASADIPI